MWRKAFGNVFILKRELHPNQIRIFPPKESVPGTHRFYSQSQSASYLITGKFTGENVSRCVKVAGRRSPFWHPVPVASVQQDFSIGNRYFHIDQTTRLRVSSLERGTSGTTGQLEAANLSKNEYEDIAEETLDSLTGYFDEILERSAIEDSDVSYGSGVLTIKLGAKNGTYVINKQTPNKQVWLSSPTSGPKRYDFVDKTWIYKHDGRSMYKLLTEEISGILGDSKIDFEQHCAYGRRAK